MKILRRLVGAHILRRGPGVSFEEYRTLRLLRGSARAYKRDSLFYFVEANPHVIRKSSVYSEADAVYNCALTDRAEIEVANLFIANSDLLSQGSSIFRTKSNVNTENYVRTIGVPAKLFFEMIERNLADLQTNYTILLRLNCEGAEDDVIYAAREVFQDRLSLIAGSLKDVIGCKSQRHYDDMITFIEDNDIPFVFFNSSINSWVHAHTAVIELYKRLSG